LAFFPILARLKGDTEPKELGVLHKQYSELIFLLYFKTTLLFKLVKKGRFRKVLIMTCAQSHKPLHKGIKFP